VPRSPYVVDYDGTFTFPVPVSQLWTQLVQVDRFQSWWSWLREFRVEGSGLESGAVLHGVVAPPLPYRMRVDVVLEESVPEQHISARVHGDLDGVARLVFEGDEDTTVVRATWTMEMMQRPMRLAATVAYPLLRWGHDRVVDATVESFRRHIVGEGSF
jgi:hypothetical protein